MNVLPPVLYKYQSCNVYSLRNLGNHSIWFSKPDTFNDPFDCDINFDIVDVTDENVKSMITRMGGAKDKSISNEDAIKMALATTEIVKKKQWAEIGVACFAEEPENILMWSHYAEKHQGFCLKFDTSHHPFQAFEKERVIKVDYVNSYPSLSINDIPQKILSREISLPRQLLGIKSLHWDYENEWRIFSSVGNKEYLFDKSALAGIYFGCNMDKSDKRLICKLLADFPEVKTYQMIISKNEFKIFPEEISLKLLAD